MADPAPGSFLITPVAPGQPLQLPGPPAPAGTPAGQSYFPDQATLAGRDKAVLDQAKETLLFETQNAISRALGLGLALWVGYLVIKYTWRR